MRFGKHRVLRCQCGEQLTGVAPRRCPKCGAAIQTVRVQWWSFATPVVVIATCFAILIAYAYFLTK